MIGQLINEFESMSSQTVAQFNAIFVYCKLDYPMDHEIEIGAITGCDKVRQIKINGKKTYHEFHAEGSAERKAQGNKMPSKAEIEIIDNNGINLGVFKGVTNAATQLGIYSSTLYNYLNSGHYKIKEGV